MEMSDLKTPLLGNQSSLNSPIQFLKLDIKSLNAEISNFQDPLFASIQTASFVTTVSSTFDGQYLIYGTDDGTIFTLSLPSNTLTSLEGHTAHITSLKLTTDNSFIVSLSDDKTIRIWSLEDHTEYAVLEGHTEIPTQLVITNDDQYILSGGEDNTVILWDIESRAQLAVFEHDDHILSLTVSYDGLYGISGAKDCTVRIWNIEERKEEAVLNGHQDWVWSVAVTRNREFIISGSEDSHIIVWNFENRRIEFRLEGHTAYVNCLQVIRDDKILVSGGGDGKIIIWNLQDRKQVGVLEGHSSAISCLAINNTQEFVVSGAYDNNVRIWNLNDKKQEYVMSSHTDVITCAVFTGNNHFLATGSEDSTLKLWRFQDSRSEQTFLGHEDSISCLTASEDFQFIYSGGFDNIIKKWSMPQGIELGIFSGHTECIMSILLLDSDTLISAARESTIRVWNTSTYQTITTLQEHFGSVFCLATDDTHQFLVSGAEDTSICVWKTPSWEYQGKLEGHSKPVNLVHIEKSVLISGSVDRTIRIWNLVSMKQTAVLSGHSDYIKTISLSRDGRYLVSGSADKTLRVWSTDSNQIVGVLEGHTGEVNKLEITLDSQFIVSGSNDNTIRIWSLKDLQQEAVLQGHNDSISTLFLTHDSKYIISASQDSTLRIWNLLENRQEAVLSSHTDTIKSLYLSKDSRYIISGSDDKSMKVWDTSHYIQNSLVSNSCISISGSEYIFRSAGFVEAMVSGFQLTTPEVWMNDMMIVPHRLNALHILCYYNLPEKLRTAMNYGCPVIKNAYGETPLTIALNRRSQNCIDVLLEYVIELRELDLQKMKTVVQILSQDIYRLIQRGSAYLGVFLDVIFITSDPSFEIPRYSLPRYSLTDSKFIQRDDLIINRATSISQPSQDNEELLIEFQISSFSWNFESGSIQSLQLLTSLQECSFSNILTSRFITSLIEMKWNNIWIYVLIQSILYWINLALLTYLLFDFSSFLTLGSFLVLNCLFLGYEVFQGICMKSEYFKDGWNYLDIVRLVAGFIWAILGYYGVKYMPLSWIITLIFWVRGLTYFRTFRYTRFFVRMILECVKDSFSFMIILFYSTFAVASLYVVSSPGLDNMSDAFELSYQINMGEYSNDSNNLFQWICFFSATILNCVIMLNLLISILGDSFEKSQMMAQEADTLEMLDLVIELEYLMIWKRNSGKKQYLQRCDYAEQSQIQPAWEGRIKAIERKLSNVSTEFKDSITQLQHNLIQAIETQQKLTYTNLIKHIEDTQTNLNRDILQTLNKRLDKMSHI